MEFGRKRSPIDRQIFAISKRIGIPVYEMINNLTICNTDGTPLRLGERNKAVTLYRLYPTDKPDGDCIHSYKAVANRFNMSPHRVAEVVKEVCRLLRRKYPDKR